MNCYMHSGYSSPAKGVSKCSRETFVRWLLSADIPEPSASADRKKELKANTTAPVLLPSQRRLRPRPLEVYRLWQCD